jgi:hypothetical protein
MPAQAGMGNAVVTLMLSYRDSMIEADRQAVRIISRSGAIVGRGCRS